MNKKQINKSRNYNFLIKNKRGDAAIVFLVFMILVLFVFALYRFSTSSAISLDGFDLSKVQKLSSTKFVFEQSLYFAGQKAIIKTFDEFSKGNNYDYIKARKDTGEFFSLHDKLKENFASRFRENFIEIFSAQTSYDKSITYEYEMIKAGKFGVGFDNDNLTLSFNFSSVPDAVGLVNVQDSRFMKINISLNRINLNGFNEIYSTKEKCKLVNASSMKDCFENGLINFNAEILPVKENAGQFRFNVVDSTSQLNIVKLTSKSSFSFVDGDRKTTLVFIPK